MTEYVIYGKEHNYFSFSLICVYVPIKDTEQEEEKDAFYTNVEEIWDMNVKVNES
jgi:hypothetical protein